MVKINKEKNIINDDMALERYLRKYFGIVKREYKKEISSSEHKRRR